MQRENKERLGLLSILIFLGMAGICFGASLLLMAPKSYDVERGAASEYTITSPRTLEDEDATNALREAARDKTPIIYKLDEELSQRYTDEAEAFFDNIRVIRKQGEAILAARGPSFGITPVEQLPVTQWQRILPENEINSMLQNLALPLTANEGWYVLHMDEGEFIRLQDVILPKIITSLQSGQEEKNLEAKISAYLQELNATSITPEIKALGEKALRTYLKPTFVQDKEASRQAQEKNMAAITPVEIKRGDVIVNRGDIVSDRQYELLVDLDLITYSRSELKLNMGMALYIMCFVALFFAYMLVFRREIIVSRKKMFLMFIALLLTMLMIMGVYGLVGRVLPVLIGVMLAALLVEERTAIAFNIMCAFVFALFAGGRGANMLGQESIIIAASVLMGGTTAVFMLRGNQRRSAIILTGFISGIVAFVVIASMSLMLSRPLMSVLIHGAWALGCNLVSAILVVGTLAIWENMFDIATSARLNELSNTNNPLLKQLMTEAPGTYHHSAMAAALAESAAEAIGADPLLCRVGAYYHDVGKLRRPIYFKENQPQNENIHDTLPPGESASIIISHLKDGVVLLNRHKLPSAVVQIAYEHHGTTLASFFYQKALDQSPNKNVPQKAYRYPGARPSTKESAIVFLADNCEAGVRSLQNPKKEDIAALVDKIIKAKIDDGQLALAPLDFKDLSTIQQSFLRTFSGILHERIPYPDNKPTGGEN